MNINHIGGFKTYIIKQGLKYIFFFIGVEVKKEAEKKFFLYSKIMKLSGFSLDKFINAIEIGDIMVDFDAKTGHNHGTKFRFRNSRLYELYENIEEI